MEQRIALVLVASAAVLASCDSGGTSTATPEGFYAAFNAESCAQFLACERESVTSDDAASLAARATLSTSECVATRGDSLEAYLERYLDDGTIRYDEAAAKNCLASFDTLCAGGTSPECDPDTIFVGTVPDGGACEWSIQCAEGFCVTNGDPCGLCQLPLALGDTCALDGPYCDEGLECDYFGTWECVPASLGSTENVTEVGLGESCLDLSTTDRICAPELYCDATDHCAERLPIGVRCDTEYDACDRDAICLDDGAGVTRCLAVVETSTVGDPCGVTTTGYVVCRESAKLYCNALEQCAALAGDGATGADCRYDSDCDSGVCDFFDAIIGTCLANELADGAACSYDEQCVSKRCAWTANGAECAAPICY